MRSIALCSFTLILTISCTIEEPPRSADADVEVTYYRDIKPMLDAYCVNCHAEGAIAPFSLDAYASAQAVAALLPASVESRQMPPFLAAPAVRPLRYDASLSDAQIELLSTWVELGAPMGDPEEEGHAIELEDRQLDRIDSMLEMAEPYTPTLTPDEYRCFVMEWEPSAPQYLTGVQFLPGNPMVAHHAVIFHVDEKYASIIDAANGADGKPGYGCFGNASPDGSPQFPNKLVANWVPGVGATLYPEGSGSLIQPGSRVVLQMHYSILVDGPQPDQSRAALRLADEVEQSAGYLPWLDINWPTNPQSMLIPAGAAAVTHEYVADPTQSALLGEFAPGVNPNEGLVIHSLLPHMHKLGTSMFLQLERSDGSIEPMVEISRWDFDWQEEYVFEQPLTVLPGDQLRISCTWDNSAANQPIIDGQLREAVDVMWGEGTYDEMCAASVFVHGVATDDASCVDVDSIPAATGRFVATFDAPTSIRESPQLEGELRGPVHAFFFRDEDVSLTGPNAGVEPVAGVELGEIDLTAGPSAALLLDVELPAGDYQILGFMDTDGNANPDAPLPDANDPLLIPSAPRTLACQQQPTTLSFSLLLP
jgi:hypothetical protein